VHASLFATALVAGDGRVTAECGRVSAPGVWSPKGRSAAAVATRTNRHPRAQGRMEEQWRAARVAEDARRVSGGPGLLSKLRKNMGKGGG